MVYRLVTTGPIPNEQALIQAMAERVGEVVDGDGTVKTDGKLIHITGRNRLYGNSTTFAPHMLLRALPDDEGLVVAFEKLAETLQRFLGPCAKGRSSSNGLPHVVVTDETIRVWWGGATEADALVRLRPFSRRELGV
jgi:hypothetical protein